MDIHNLKMRLSRIATVQSCKADFVFTLLMTGKGLSKWETVNKIQELVNKATENKYRFIEVMKNDEDFLLMVLKP